MPEDFGGTHKRVSVWKYGEQVGELSFSLLREYYKYYLMMNADPNTHIAFMRPCFAALECLYSQVRPMLLTATRAKMDKDFKDTRNEMESYLNSLTGRGEPTYEVLLKLTELLNATLSVMQGIGMWVTSEKYISDKERSDYAYGVRKRRTRHGSESNQQ